MSTRKVIVVAGPTACGKSGLAFDLAIALNGVVINADSMQVYEDTPVISACPSEEEKKKIPHRLYQIFESSKNSSVAEWLVLAVEEIRLAWSVGKLPIVVGGTGLYIDNLINGSSPIPQTSAQAKQKIADLMQKQGLEKAFEQLRKIDAKTADKLSPNDTTRIRRALEVFEDTKIPISQWHQKPMIKTLPEAEFLVIKIMPDVKEIDERCFLRFDKMLEKGAIEEAKALLSKNLDANLPAMKALGVPELLSFCRGECSFEEAVSLGKIHTRQYAKRQRTWFGNKLKADIVFEESYKEQKNLINCVKKAL